MTPYLCTAVPRGEVVTPPTFLIAEGGAGSDPLYLYYRKDGGVKILFGELPQHNGHVCS